MADTKISALPSATTPLAGTEVVPLVQSGTTKKVATGDLFLSTVPSGTANSVPYLNGSKVVTTGSALTFDGTNLGVGTASPSTYGELAVYHAKTGTVAISVTQQNALTNDGAKLSTFYQATETASLKYYWDGSQFRGQLYSYGPLAFTLGSSPSEQMRLTSTGLGIGTSSPAFKLDVSGASNNGIRYSNGTVSTVLGENGGSGFVGTTTNHSLRFATNASVVATLDSSGNLIHSAPATPPTLTTNGTMVFNLTSDTNLRVSVRGSDGVTRTANITLA